MFSKPILSKDAKTISPEVRKAKREKRKRFWRKTRKVVLWTLAIGFVAHLSLNIYASVQLNREFAAIRQKGDPIKFSEIEPPQVPDAQNAALVYKQATDALHFAAEEKYALSATRRELTPAMKETLESVLRNNQESLALARRAAAMPQCRFPLDWKGNPILFLFPYYAELRELARLLALDAGAKARSGDREGALGDVRAIFGISHHLSREPVLIGYLVALGVDGIAHRALGETLDSVPLSVAQARALEASLPKDDWTLAFRNGLVGERMMGIFAFESFGQTMPQTTPQSDEDGQGLSIPAWITYPLVWVMRPILKLDEVQTLRMWRARLDPPQSQQVPISVAFARSQDAAVSHTPFYASLTKILFPVFSRASDNRDRAEVWRRQREVALALNCFRSARGRYPANLQQAASVWGNSLPLDPYSQKPFVYRSDGKTFVLYSIGVNRADDGGKNRYSPGTRGPTKADDIEWKHSDLSIMGP